MALTPTEEAQTRQLLAQQAPILSLADNEATIISKLGATKVNLSSLGSAVTFDDADIMLIRQGTTDLSIAGSVVKAAVGVPDASETVKGKVELATSAETITGTDNTRAVHPAGLTARTATETRTGIAEVATQAETDAGTDDARMVTPLKLANATSRGLGYGQTWQNVTGSRTEATTYYNTTGKPIMISICPTTTAGANTLTIDGVAVASTSANNAPLTAIVGPGSSYSMVAAGTITTWAELR